VREQLGLRLRRFHKEHADIKVFGMLGNDDWSVFERDLEDLERDGAFFLIHQRAHALARGLWIAGSSFVPVTPFGMSDYDRLDAPGWKPPAKFCPAYFSTPDGIVGCPMSEFSRRETLQECLAALAAKSAPAKTVYVFHAPPLRTKLDQLQDRTHVGSAAIRAFIEKHQPPVTLHGHIHESPLVSGSMSDTIGRTLALNPGDSRTKLRALRITADGARIEWRLLP
jgi:hypothetical protein